MFDEQGRRVFLTGNSAGFLVVLEARPGTSGVAVGISVPPPTPGAGVYPSLQIQAGMQLGNGSATICDTQTIAQGGGGVPGFHPPSIEPTPAIVDALVDFACRFEPFLPSIPCTLGGDGNDGTVTPGLASIPGSRQFCMIATTTTSFAIGVTLLTARVRDNAGNVGPTQQIVVRRVTPPPAN